MTREIQVELNTFRLIWTFWEEGDINEDQIIYRVLSEKMEEKLSFRGNSSIVNSETSELVQKSVASKQYIKLDKDSRVSNFEKVRWVDDVVEALRSLGGEANLSDIYKKVEEIRGKNGRTIVRSLDATVRQTLEAHSSDSENFQQRADFFKNVGRGRWKLR